jgi:methionyl-tRNA formyltransferase
MALEGVKGLIGKNYPPGFVVVHNDLQIDKLYDSFYAPIEKLCSDYDIPLFKTAKINEIKDNFNNFDFGICAGFMEIIGKEVFEIPKHGIINLHCGKLPNYRGRAPISRTIMDGNKYLTVSLHKIDEGVDSGDLLLEHEIEIQSEDDVNTIYKKCCDEAADILIKGVEILLSKIKNIFTKQDLTLKPKSNRKISEEERIINWEKNVEEIHNLIRAITIPYPCAYSVYDGRKYVFVKSEIFDKDRCNARQPGELYFADDEYILINCIDGLLKVTDIRDENNNNVNPEETFKPRGIFR